MSSTRWSWDEASGGTVSGADVGLAAGGEAPAEVDHLPFSQAPVPRGVVAGSMVG